MRYFVTGATGFIGGVLARELINRGDQVVALARDPAKAGDLAALGVEVHKGDITLKESMRAPMTGVDGVYHVAGWYKIGTRDAGAGQAINVDGTRNVLEVMRELDISKGVYTSTLAINSDTHGRVVDENYVFAGKHISEYDRTKADAHKVAHEFIAAGLPLVIVQPGLVYGPTDFASPIAGTLIQYLQRKLPMVPQGVAYCWGHVDDIVQGHILAMEKGKSGESYIIAGEPKTLIDALGLAEQHTGIPAPKMHPTPGMMHGMAAIMGAVGRVIPLPEMFSGEYLRVAAGATYLGSNAKARRELGYDPRPLADGLPETLDALMHALNIKKPAAN
jgi:nucleoside-diphosphate-sugar epimerase